MELLDYLFMGVLQGVTEWLPISSSGQSMIALINLLDMTPDVALRLVIYLHAGTLLAVTVKFRGELFEVLQSLPRFRGDRLTLFLVVSTLFTGLVGLPVYVLMKGLLESSAADGGWAVTALIGVFLIFTGVVIRFSKKRFGVRGIKDICLRDMIVCGIVQGFTIIPGVSRSGLTVSSLLILGFEQDIALKLSFLMSVPAVLGAVSLNVFKEGFVISDMSGVLAGVAVAFLTGYVSIEALIRFSRRVKFDVFCIIFGLLTLVFMLVVRYYGG